MKKNHCGHPDRPHHARNKCKSCYVMEQRKPDFEPRVTVAERVIDLIETRPVTWFEASEYMDGVTPEHLRQALNKADRKDLVTKVNRYHVDRLGHPKNGRRLKI